MIEVFKTDVNDPYSASMLIDQIRKTFADYEANFDLQDCDKILRVKCTTGGVDASILIDLLHDFGFRAEVLEDHQPTSGKRRIRAYEMLWRNDLMNIPSSN